LSALSHSLNCSSHWMCQRWSVTSPAQTKARVPVFTFELRTPVPCVTVHTDGQCVSKHLWVYFLTNGQDYVFIAFENIRFGLGSCEIDCNLGR